MAITVVFLKQVEESFLRRICWLWLRCIRKMTVTSWKNSYLNHHQFFWDWWAWSPDDRGLRSKVGVWVCLCLSVCLQEGVVKNWGLRASLVAQWLRVCLPMQGTRVQALVWEDPTCRGATRPVSHNYSACASGACAPQWEAAIMRGPRTARKSGPHLPQVEKALAQKRRPNTAINK